MRERQESRAAMGRMRPMAVRAVPVASEVAGAMGGRVSQRVSGVPGEVAAQGETAVMPTVAWGSAVPEGVVAMGAVADWGRRVVSRGRAGRAGRAAMGGRDRTVLRGAVAVWARTVATAAMAAMGAVAGPPSTAVVAVTAVAAVLR